jgi:hypothetical protein
VYFCVTCRTEVRTNVLPQGWLQIQMGDINSDKLKLVGRYCGLPCLAADVQVWMERFAAAGG